MKASFAVFLALSSFAAGGQVPTLEPDAPINCDSCAEWNAPREPYRIFGNTYYVGVAGLSAVLVTSPSGLILLDGGLPQSAPAIDASIRKLGFQTRDIRLIVNSHAHYDHAGGIAALQRASGASVATSAAGARALERGQPTPDDPQYVEGSNRFPAVHDVSPVKDGGVLRVGDLAITAHLTPGHTPGGTSWSWRSCEGSACRSIVYADSLTAVSEPGFRFTGGGARPDIAGEFRRSIETIAALPCDVLITTHPSAGEGKSCRAYADNAMKGLEKRVREEREGR